MASGVFTLGTHFIKSNLAQRSAQLTFLFPFIDVVTGLMTGKEKGDFGDLFTRAAIGSTVQEEAPTDLTKSVKRGSIMSDLGNSLHDLMFTHIGMKIPALALPIMCWQGFQGYREFRQGDGNGIFDVMNGLNNLSNIGMLLTSIPLLRFLAPRMVNRVTMAKSLKTAQASLARLTTKEAATSASKLCRKAQLAYKKECASAKKLVSDLSDDITTLDRRISNRLSNGCGPYMQAFASVFKPISGCFGMAFK